VSGVTSREGSTPPQALYHLLFEPTKDASERASERERESEKERERAKERERESERAIKRERARTRERARESEKERERERARPRESQSERHSESESERDRHRERKRQRERERKRELARAPPSELCHFRSIASWKLHVRRIAWKLDAPRIPHVRRTLGEKKTLHVRRTVRARCLRARVCTKEPRSPDRKVDVRLPGKGNSNSRARVCTKAPRSPAPRIESLLNL